ncbi:MAG: DUF3137 domain-containing protein [Hyphomonadaceae bacterium]|nr:DUF3137 domain-containing protein [Hyphomonadaceae bacterium]
MSGFQAEDETSGAGLDVPPRFKQFERTYYNEIRPMLQAREGERVKAVDIAKKTIGGGVLLALIGGALSLFVFNAPHALIAGAVGGVLVGAIGTSPIRKLSGEAKALLVRPVAESLDLFFEPKPGQVDSISDHRRVGLLPSYDRSSFEDQLVGAHEGVDFEFFECTLKQRRTSTSNGRTRTHYVTVFKGQCIRMDFHKRFFGETLVRRDAGIFNMFGGRRGMDRARLEDPEFEKAFEVYTTDQVEARFLLTPDFMQTLVDLERALHGKKLRCAFSGEEMFVAVEGGDLFEPGSLFKSLDDPARVRDLLLDFEAVFNLIETVSARRRVEGEARGTPDQD